LINAIILEDDISSTLKYESVLKELNVNVMATYKSWEEVLPDIKSKRPDFMVVDLSLGKNQSGMKFVEEIQNLFIPIVIITGYSIEGNAQKALELNVRHYLTKPVDRTTLRFVFGKLINELRESENSKDLLLVKDRGNLIKIPHRRILKIEIDGNYSLVFVESGKRYVIKSSLTKVQEQLDSEKFVRCHRSTLINFDFVKELDLVRNKLILRIGEEVSVGNRFRTEVKNHFKDYYK